MRDEKAQGVKTQPCLSACALRFARGARGGWAVLVDGAFGTGGKLRRRSIVRGLQVVRIRFLRAQGCFPVHHVMDDFLVLFMFCACAELLPAQSTNHAICFMACHYHPPKALQFGVLFPPFSRRFQECLHTQTPAFFRASTQLNAEDGVGSCEGGVAIRF